MGGESLRILHLIDHLGLGGAQTFLVSLLQAWPSPEDNLHLLGLGHKCEVYETFKGLPRVQVPPPAPHKLSLRNIRLARRFMREGKFDIVHCHLPKATALALLSPVSPKVGLILHEHGDPALRSQPYHAVTRLRWKKSAAVIANAGAVADDLATHAAVPRNHIRVVPNGVHLESFDGSSKLPAGVWEELRIPKTSTVIGFAGRLAEQKGVTFLLEALARVYEHHNDIAAVIVGDGPLRPALEVQAAALNLGQLVHFVGYQTNVAQWMALFDVGVVPSLWEPFGISAIELMASRVPIVASNIGGLKENISDEDTGLLVPPRDVPALTEAISRLLQDASLRKQLAEAARTLVAEHFTIASTARQIRDLYIEVCSGGAA